MPILDDSVLNETQYSPVCTFCKHLSTTTFRSCTAYPKERGIPATIWEGDNPHTSPVAGDHGVQFVRKSD